MKSRPWASGAIFLGALLWAAGLVVVPPMAAAAGPGSVAALASALCYRAGAAVCHQQGPRSLHIAGVQMPVCARCAGLYGGAAAGACAAWLWMAASRGRGRQATARLSPIRALLVAAALPTALLWVGEHALGIDVGNAARALGAAPLGAAVAWLAGAVAGGARITDAGSTPAIH